MEVGFGNCETCDQGRKKSCPFLHYPKGGENAPWRVRFLHRLTSLKVIYSSTIIGAVIDAIAIYTFISNKEFISKHGLNDWIPGISIFLLTVSIGLFIFILLLLSHYKSQRWMLSDVMHRISHELRDMNTTINKIKEHECIHENDKNRCGYEFLMLYCNRIADYTEQYFSLLTKGYLPYFDRKNLRCVIRFTAAYPKNNSSDSQECGYEMKYFTIGRSKAYNLSARKVSKAFSADYGVFSILRFKKYQGVLICNDLEKARMMGYWADPVDTEKDVRPIQSIMVVPINGYIDGEVRNIATITIDTYRKETVFKRPHIDIFRAIADQLGAVFPGNIRKLFPSQPLGAALPKYADSE